MDEEHGYLLNFPYEEKHGQYQIQKRKQTKNACTEFFSIKVCQKLTKDEIIYRVMFWVGVLLAISAIIVTLDKELDEGKRSEEVILKLSIAELILAIFSIVISLSKHLIRHNSLVLLQKNIRVEKPLSNKSITQRKKLYITFTVILLCFVTVILVPFAVMHSKDDETYQYLTYTKFTTTITLFVSILLDGIINDLIADAFASAKLDQCKIALHQIKVELVSNLNESKEKERAEQIRGFIDSHNVFTLKEAHHIRYVPADNQLMVEDSPYDRNESAPLTSEKIHKHYNNHSEML